MSTPVHERFLATAARRPDAPALAGGGRELTYRECAGRVERAAAALAGAFPRGRLALNAAKSPEVILAMLACLRAGLTYVPIDPASPLERRRLILEDCGASALVVDERAREEWAAGPAPVRLLNLDELETLSPGGAPGEVDDEDVAYVLYTSGSTGRPKGVTITHRNVAAFVDWAAQAAGIRPGDRVAVHAPLHFDLPVLDIYAGFACGATVCPIGEQTVMFPQALLRFLRRERIAVLYAVPSALVALLDRSTLADGGLPDLRVLLYAGEEFHPAPLARLMALLPGVSVLNLYGPVETNAVTAQAVTAELVARGRVPIGRPIAGARIWLVDGEGRPGDEGEIVVAGPTVSPGYLGRPDLTAAARLEIGEGGRMWTCHRTGDVGRRDPDGTLRFLGRRDVGMVKTRGFRVELGDVEANLAAHPMVAEAGVVAVPHEAYTNLLHAFVVPSAGAAPTEAELLAWCAAKLPAYMLPQRIEVRAALPRTSTGKLDRRALLQPEAAR